MSTWVGVEIDGLSVENYQNHHSPWFFNRSDRVRENCERDEHGSLSDKAFIGYRASVASIRRRMTLAGYDLAACEMHFEEHLSIVLDEARTMLRNLQKQKHDDVASRVNDAVDAYQRFILAVEGTCLADWIAVFPLAVALKKSVTPVYLTDTRWVDVSSLPLVNAMLSDIPLYGEYPCTDLFNFPSNDGRYFQIAYLSCCPDEALCELNIVPLIQSGWEADFRDLDEIQRQETGPHRFGRQSIEEIMRLSSTQPDNLSLQRMCYASIITAMEAYLGDILKREIFNRPAVKERFVASYEPFMKTKFNLADIYSKLSTLDKDISEALDALSLHKLETANVIFSKTLLTDFPPDAVSLICTAVKQRHHIVHRNGRDTQGKILSIDYQTVQVLANKVFLFIQNVDRQILDGLLDESSTG